MEFLTADEVVALVERKVRAQGATFDDVDERIAAELGISFDEWHGYMRVKFATVGYQAGLGARGLPQGKRLEPPSRADGGEGSST